MSKALLGEEDEHLHSSLGYEAQEWIWFQLYRQACCLSFLKLYTLRPGNRLSTNNMAVKRLFQPACLISCPAHCLS